MQQREYVNQNRVEYARLLEECKTLESRIREKDKDLLQLNGFGDSDRLSSHDDLDGVSIKTFDTVDAISVDSSTDKIDTISQDASLDSNGSEATASRDASADVTPTKKSNKEEFSLMNSIFETRENLREMVESASKRGADRWRRFITKSKQQEKRRSRKNTQKQDDIDIIEGASSPNMSVDGLNSPRMSVDDSPKLNGNNNNEKSFDIELDCHSCGKKIIESSDKLVNGKLADSSLEVIECFSCIQERRTSEFEAMHLKLQPRVSEITSASALSISQMQRTTRASPLRSPSKDVVYADENSRNRSMECVVINGEDTPLEKRDSTSSNSSTYSVRSLPQNLLLAIFCWSRGIR